MYQEHIKWQWLSRILTFLPLSILCAYWFLSTHHRISWVFTLLVTMYLLYGLKVVEQRYGYTDQRSALLGTCLTWCWPAFLLFEKLKQKNENRYWVYLNHIKIGEITQQEINTIKHEIFFSFGAINRQIRNVGTGIFITIKDLAMVVSTMIVLGSVVYVQVDSLGFSKMVSGYVSGQYNGLIMEKGFPIAVLWTVIGTIKNTQWSIVHEVDNQIRLKLNQVSTGSINLLKIKEQAYETTQVENSPEKHLY